MKKLIKKIKGYLPVTRKQYKKDLERVITTIGGLEQSDAQHSQMEMNLIRNMSEIENKRNTKSTDKKGKDPSYA